MFLISNEEYNYYKILKENVLITYDGTEYKIHPYTSNAGGVDPNHGPRLKPIPSKYNRVTKGDMPTIAISRKDKDHPIDLKNCSRGGRETDKEYKKMIDLIGGLAVYDYDAIADFNENTKSEDSMNKLMERFMNLSKDEQEKYIEEGKARRIKFNKTTKYEVKKK